MKKYTKLTPEQWEEKRELKRKQIEADRLKKQEELQAKKSISKAKRKEYKKEYGKQYREKNREYYLAYYKEWNKKNRSSGHPVLTNEQKLEIAKHKKEHVRIIRKNYQKEKKHDNEIYREACNIKCLISQAIKKEKYRENSKITKILGCSITEFKQFIESKFEPWMNWNNYGNTNGVATGVNISWDISHIVPASNCSSIEELVKLNHYTNLKPICSYTNRFIKPHKKLE